VPTLKKRDLSNKQYNASEAPRKIRTNQTPRQKAEK
jgi:hypothetical protein